MNNRWPFPGDAPLVRSRKVAWAYRATIEEIVTALRGDDEDKATTLARELPERLTELDTRFCDWGESWITPGRAITMDDWLTATEAGQLIGVTSGSIHKLRVRGRLPARHDGSRLLYLASDVIALSGEVRRRKPNTTDRVPANGRSVCDE